MPPKAVWALDIGNNALKALKVQKVESGLEVLDFDYIEHSRLLSGGGLTHEQRQQIVDQTLGKFAENKGVAKEEVAISIAGKASFARFVKLPPVEKKGIPKIVQYEAVQQIPFDINEVEWDWQLMEDPDSPDTEVGLFAIKNETISEIIDHYASQDMNVTCVQISPISLYNFCHYEFDGLAELGEKPIIVLDMGADNTTMVVCTQHSVWQRSINIGGNTFTEAIADTFKLKFEKAEKLKRSAPVSKYAKQIFTAMKPVFTDLSSEIQRSLGFYNSSGPGKDKGFERIILLGGGMKLQGLAKYLQKSLGLTVVKPDTFGKLKVGEGVSTAKFHENLSDFGVVYGLGVQMLEGAKIDTNLLPRKIARSMEWSRKSKFFNMAAGFLLLVSIVSLGKAVMDSGKYKSKSPVRSQISSAVSQAQGASSDLRKQTGREDELNRRLEEAMSLFEYRDVIPKLNETIIKCLPNEENTPGNEDLYKAYKTGDVGTILSYPRPERKVLFITSAYFNYSDSMMVAGLGKTLSTNKRRTTRGGGGGMEGGGMMGGPGGMMGYGGGMMGYGGGMPGGPMMGGGPGYGGGGRPSSSRSRSDSDDSSEDGQGDGPGFVVVIEGYSPYKVIAELLDPAGVRDQVEKWGVVTRLENLQALFPDSVFELFKKNSVDHFKLETGEVDLNDPDMPLGIGIEQVVERVPLAGEERTDTRAARRSVSTRDTKNVIQQEAVLIDPMTGEEMSKTYDLWTAEEVASNPELSERDIGRIKLTRYDEPQYIVRDYWFRISAKVLWKNAPEDAGTDQY